MAIHAKSRLGAYYVAFRLATQEQIDTCLQNLRPGQMLGHALVEAQVIDKKTCELVATVERMYRKTAARCKKAIPLDEKTLIGGIMIALGIVTQEQIDDCFAYQAAERAKGNDPGRLGEILVLRNHCSPADRDLAMQVQDWLRGVN